MDIMTISKRIAASYDFKTKMKLNAVAIEELARALDSDDLNSAAESLSPETHKLIQALADSIAKDSKKKSD